MWGVGRGLGSSGKASEGTCSASRNKDQPCEETGSQSCHHQKRILADNLNEPKYRSFQNSREEQHVLLMEPSEAPVRLLTCQAVDNMGVISSQYIGDSLSQQR